MKILRLLILTLAFGIPALAQLPVPIKWVATLPATCTVNSKYRVMVYKYTATRGLYQCLTANTWTAVGGGGGGAGDVVGPASSTDNAVARFDSTTGKLLQNSAVIVDDNNGISHTLGNAASVGHLIKMAATPTGNPFEIQPNGSTTPLVSFAADGSLKFGAALPLSAPVIDIPDRTGTNQAGIRVVSGGGAVTASSALEITGSTALGGGAAYVHLDGTNGLLLYTNNYPITLYKSGGAGANEIRFNILGSESGRIDNSSTAGQTRFFLYDVDNATLERVTVGAADSCGAGFKCLRIPN